MQQAQKYKQYLHTRRTMLDELRRDGLLENDPERARGLEAVIPETALLSVLHKK